MINSRKLEINLTLKEFLYVLIFDTVIAFFLTVIEVGSGFKILFIFSQCIGILIFLSVQAAFSILKKANFALKLISTIIAIAIGLTVGSIMGAAVNGINVIYFIKNIDGLFQTAFIGSFFTLIIIYIFVLREQISLRNQMFMEARIKVLDLEKRAIETELKLFQSQIEPHFLFNTLANIIGLIEANPKKACEMLESFTNFLRTSISIAREKTIDSTSN